MDQQERIDMLYEAQEYLEEAIQLIKGAVRGTDSQSYAESYVIPTLIMAKTEDHGYLGSQPANLDELIQAMDGSDDEE